MIKVVCEKNETNIEIKGNLHEVKVEFARMCIEICKSIGKQLEEERKIPEGEGSVHALADLITTFVFVDVNPFYVLKLDKKINEFNKKTVDYIKDAINEFSSDTVEELDIDKLADFLGKIFGVKERPEAGEPDAAKPAQEVPEETECDNGGNYHSDAVDDAEKPLV